jgi:hypothetical protein
MTEERCPHWLCAHNVPIGQAPLFDTGQSSASQQCLFRNSTNSQCLMICNVAANLMSLDFAMVLQLLSHMLENECVHIVSFLRGPGLIQIST